MSGLIQNSTVHRSSVVGTFGELQVVAADDPKALVGFIRLRETAETARLRDLLSDAIKHARETSLVHRQSALWSNSTVNAARFGRSA